MIVLNDNGMSIAPNVGALSRYFNRIRLNPKLYHAREDVEETSRRLPSGHRQAVRAPRPDPEGVDQGLLGAGPVVRGARRGVRRGRSTATTCRPCARRSAMRSRPTGPSSCTSRPLRGRASTPPRRAGSRGWRSGTRRSRSRSSAAASRSRRPRPRSPRRPSTRRCSARRSWRSAGATSAIVGITAAMNSGTGLNILQKELPERYYDVGIAEQHAVLFAAGLALRDEAGRRDLLDLPPARLRPDRPRRLPPEPERRVRDGPRRACRRRRPDSPRRVRHRLHALPAEHRDDGAARRGDARDMLHTAVRYDDGPIALRYPRGNAEGVPLPSGRRRSRSGVARSSARAREWRSWATASASAVARAAELMAEPASTRRSPTRASPSRSTAS